jgi:hypothetical protein
LPPAKYSIWMRPDCSGHECWEERLSQCKKRPRDLNLQEIVAQCC